MLPTWPQHKSAIYSTYAPQLIYSTADYHYTYTAHSCYYGTFFIEKYLPMYAALLGTFSTLQRAKPPPERLTHIRIRGAVRLLREVSLSAVIYKWNQCRKTNFLRLYVIILPRSSLQLHNTYLIPNARTCCVRSL